MEKSEGVRISLKEEYIILAMTPEVVYGAGHIAVWLEEYEDKDVSMAKTYQIIQKMDAKGIINRSHGRIKVNKYVQKQLTEENENDGRQEDNSKEGGTQTETERISETGTESNQDTNQEKVSSGTGDSKEPGN